MGTKKIIGWVLLAVGLLIIFWGLYSSYNIFTARKPVPEIFKTEEEKDSLSQKEEISSVPMEEEIRKMMGEQMKGIIPSGFLSKLLNLVSWSLFAGILFWGGGRISGIGIKLIREKLVHPVK